LIVIHSISFMVLFLALRRLQFGNWFCQHDHHSFFLIFLLFRQLSRSHSSQFLKRFKFPHFPLHSSISRLNSIPKT
jgi:hypothetical protein